MPSNEYLNLKVKSVILLVSVLSYCCIDGKGIYGGGFSTPSGGLVSIIIWNRIPKTKTIFWICQVGVPATTPACVIPMEY